MADFVIKQNCLEPDLEATLKDASGTGIDLTAATGVRFHMRKKGASTAKVDAAATIVTAASGSVKYSWASGDTDTYGAYYGEFEITWNTGEKEIVPNDEDDKYIDIEVLEALA